jgi:ABC-type transporter Mla subunit MlaD
MRKQTKAKPVPADDSQLQTRVLLEQIDQNVKVVAEQHGSIVKRLDNIESKLGQHDQRFDKIESTLNSVKNAVMEVDEKVTRVEHNLETAVTNHEQRLQKLEAVR